MARIVVAGGGICGMAGALMLARDGHEVTVLDRDPGPVPDDVEQAWSDWNRRGVAQFRLAHVLLARGYQVLDAALPDVVETLRANGGLVFNQVAELLAAIPGATPHDEDRRFETVTGRRTSIEWSLAHVLAEEPGVEVRRGAAIDGLVTGPCVLDGVVHVAGVRLAGGDEIAADLVVDATGRRSPTSDWLVAIGGQPPVEESEDVGFSYAGRFLRSADGSVPEHRTGALTPCGSISLLTIPSDNGTWAATIYTASDDAPLRRVRDWGVFQRVWRAFPEHAHWLDGEPIGEMASMSGAVDRTRRFVVDGRPIVTGMVTIADAHACTNPSIGRGMTLGLMHTTAMRDAVRAHLDDPVQLALALDATTAEQIEPWHAATREIDRGRMVEMRAAIEGRVLEPAPETAMGAALTQATRTDGDALRWLGEIVQCLATPMEVFSRPGVFERVLELAGAAGPAEQYGPDRSQLLTMCAP
jgi:2-polyprenyl-6-methoxyphenol hydroxylase-like FAD-dependent oxidoreductase